MATQLATTAPAAELIGRLRNLHGPLLFHLSAGCCDGTAPICMRQDEFFLGEGDVLLGEAAGVPFYTAAAQAAWLADANLVLDVVESQSDSFSLEAGDGYRFIARTERCAPKSAL
ncbi:MAG: DUF779 domain-containing protein [Terracidiphilus sp.]